jgi:hypothetical protein
MKTIKAKKVELNDGSIVHTTNRLEAELNKAIKNVISKFDFSLSEREPTDLGYDDMIANSISNITNYFSGKSYLA